VSLFSRWATGTSDINNAPGACEVARGFAGDLLWIAYGFFLRAAAAAPIGATRE
jgi:hypothetical protein